MYLSIGTFQSLLSDSFKQIFGLLEGFCFQRLQDIIKPMNTILFWNPLILIYSQHFMNLFSHCTSNEHHYFHLCLTCIKCIKACFSSLVLCTSFSHFLIIFLYRKNGTKHSNNLEVHVGCSRWYYWQNWTVGGRLITMFMFATMFTLCGKE